MIEWSLFSESWPQYAAGLWLTLQLTVFALCRAHGALPRRWRAVHHTSKASAEVLRGR